MSMVDGYRATYELLKAGTHVVGVALEGRELLVVERTDALNVAEDDVDVLLGE